MASVIPLLTLPRVNSGITASMASVDIDRWT